nr:hypothetical protein [Candidatus Microthrix sp.]
MVGDKTTAFDDDVWELYDATPDLSQAVDLSKDHPENSPTCSASG